MWKRSTGEVIVDTSSYFRHTVLKTLWQQWERNRWKTLADTIKSSWVNVAFWGCGKRRRFWVWIPFFPFYISIHINTFSEEFLSHTQETGFCNLIFHLWQLLNWYLRYLEILNDFRDFMVGWKKGFSSVFCNLQLEGFTTLRRADRTGPRKRPQSNDLLLWMRCRQVGLICVNWEAPVAQPVRSHEQQHEQQLQVQSESLRLMSESSWRSRAIVENTHQWK